MNGMDTGAKHNMMWERRQEELWERIFQVTQDVVLLADTLGEDSGGVIMKEEMVRAAMTVGKYLVRATAADDSSEFEGYVAEARMMAIEADYWLRLAYIVQQRDDVQRDLSSVITQYATIIHLLQKLTSHVHQSQDGRRHSKGPKVSL